MIAGIPAPMPSAFLLFESRPKPRPHDNSVTLGSSDLININKTYQGEQNNDVMVFCHPPQTNL